MTAYAYFNKLKTYHSVNTSYYKAKRFLLNRPMSYAASIRALRSGRNWTQADLAEQIGGGITNQSVSGWERGISKPSRENVFELSRIFGVHLERFQTEADTAIPSQLIQARAPLSSASLVFVASSSESLTPAHASKPPLRRKAQAR
jgi:transcriptional regulator with XRE-family HTH domain